MSGPTDGPSPLSANQGTRIPPFLRRNVRLLLRRTLRVYFRFIVCIQYLMHIVSDSIVYII